MNRREFLKFTGALVIASAVPETALSILAKEALLPELVESDNDYSHFDPSNQYGNTLMLKERPVGEVKEDAFLILEDNMRLSIPPTHWHRVEYIIRDISESADPFSASYAAAGWKYS